MTDELEQLKKYCASVSQHFEAGVEYFHLKDLRLPEGCTPAVVDAIFRPAAGDDYESRLGFLEKIATPFPRNWTEIRILDRNWAAFSWRYPFNGLTLVQKLLGHFEGLISNK